MQTNDPIQFVVGGEVFKTTKQTIKIAGDNSYLASLVKNHNFETSNVIYVDRNPLCFSIVMDYLRGYSLKKSGIDVIWKKSKLDRKDFYITLSEDVLFYGITGLINDFTVILSEEYPDLIENDDVSILFEDLQEAIKSLEMILEEETEDDDKEFMRSFEKYKKLTPKSSKSEINKAIKEISNHLELIQFKARICTYFAEFLLYITLFIEYYMGDKMDLGMQMRSIVRKLRNNSGLIKQLFESSKTVAHSPILLFIFSSIIQLVMFHKLKKNWEGNNIILKNNNSDPNIEL